MWQIILAVGSWLSSHEWLAIWLEGVALVALFVLEYIDSRSNRKELLEQMNIARQQAEAARLSAQSLLNSERAWLTADLRWAEARGRIIFGDSVIPPNNVASTTAVALVLEIRNDGKTPAWIENISAGMEIVGQEEQPERPAMEYFEPLGAEKARNINLRLSCPGKPKMLKSEFLRVHITVNYRDIFESREMTLEFHIQPLGEVIRRLGQRQVNFTSPPDVR